MAKKVPRWAAARPLVTRASSPDFRIRTSMALPTLAGPAINEHTALTITAVYNAVSLISNAIACLDSGVAERTEDGGRRPAVELPLFDILSRRPNRKTTAFNYRRSNMLHALTTGNGYSEIEFRGNEPFALHLLEPRNVDPRLTDSGKLVYHLIRENRALPAENVIHTANIGWDGVRGYSPITMARESLGLAKAQEQYQAGLIGNSAQANGFLMVPHTLKEDARNRLRADYEAMHRGPENAGTLGILDGGARWVATAFSPADSELILSRGFSVAEVARLFNIPQHLIGLLEHATFSNIEQQLMEFYTFTLLPWLANIEQEMDCKLFSRAERRDYFVYHDIKTLLRADTATQNAQDASDFLNGFASQNEVRERRGMNPIDHPNADKHFIPVNNLAAVEDMPEKGPAPAPAPADRSEGPGVVRLDGASGGLELAVDYALESLAGANP